MVGFTALPSRFLLIRSARLLTANACLLLLFDAVSLILWLFLRRVKIHDALLKEPLLAYQSLAWSLLGCSPFGLMGIPAAKTCPHYSLFLF